MRDFKVMKELVKALTYIGDAIAGNVKTNADNSKEYDGIEVLPSSDDIILTTFGLTIDENANFSKLGDVFSDNAINDINYFIKTYDQNNFYITRKYDIRYDASASVGVGFNVDSSNLLLHYFYNPLKGSGKPDFDGIAFRVELSALSDDLTKDTLLTKITAG